MTDPDVLPHLDDAGRPTLRTIAYIAGVHVSTVSRVLSPSLAPGVRVASAKTTEKIRKIARDLDFTKNPHAAGLRTSRSNLVGVLVPRLTDIVLATIYEGISESARAQGYQTVVTNTHDEQQLRDDAVDMLLARRVDGLVVGDAVVDDDALAHALEKRDLPFVLVSRRSGTHPSVTCDDNEGGRLAARHLLELGHTEVGLVAGEPYASTSVDRGGGFLEVYAAAGHPIPESRIVRCPFDVAGGRTATDRLLSAQHPPTGIFAVNDFAAIGALGAIRAAQLRVGSDVAVVGYNDTPLAGQLPVPLTSVRSPMHEMGVRAMELLTDRINGVDVESVRLMPTLSIRESSDPTRA
ncbi:LacI family DNA-binding transcriptional regulator [Rhodococcus sp. 27YEA15]|uniref:LacI family DNA-binding transcriptional regulator n=1 Tax=Rhodococcus sp. 27YEA15 TaxID=3156259 RepID=UPI003C7BAF56